MGALHHTARWRRRAQHQLCVEPLCRACLAEGKTVPARVADHVEPHHNDPMKFWRGALQSLCTHCHESRKKYAEARGFDNTIGIDGWPTDVRHPVFQARDVDAGRGEENRFSLPSRNDRSGGLVLLYL